MHRRGDEKGAKIGATRVIGDGKGHMEKARWREGAAARIRKARIDSVVRWEPWGRDGGIPAGAGIKGAEAETIRGERGQRA